MYQRNLYSLAELDQDFEQALSPERRLLLAIVERSIYDLKPDAGHLVRRESLSWFREEPTKEDWRITAFSYIKEELNFGPAILRFIDAAIQEAKEYEDYFIQCMIRGVTPDPKQWSQDRKQIICPKGRTINANSSFCGPVAVLCRH